MISCVACGAQHLRLLRDGRHLATWCDACRLLMDNNLLHREFTAADRMALRGFRLDSGRVGFSTGRGPQQQTTR